MKRNMLTKQELEREHAAYRYLEALDTGDIDAIIAILEKATYDAPLEHVVLDAHQAYFQVAPVEQIISPAGQDAELDLPTLKELEPHTRRSVPRQRRAWWSQTLAALLLVGVLAGGFMAVLNWYGARSGRAIVASSATGTGCSLSPWQQFKVTSPGGLASVAIISANDAWAVGEDQNSAVIEHWNGESWQAFVTHAPMHSALSQVAAVSRTDIWAVGYTVETASGRDKTLVEHWDGSRWSVIPSPDGASGNGQFMALKVIATNNIWAVGTFSDASQLSYSLLEHWNGTAWQVVPIQSTNAFVRGDVVTITGTSSNDLWIAGEIDNSRVASQGIVGQPQGFVAHWDGMQWSLLQPPNSMAVNSLDVASANDIWITGTSASTKTSGLLSHWDGHMWNQVALPISSTSGLLLKEIVTFSHGNVWLVGAQTGTNGSTLYPVMFHWNGQTWQKEQIPTPESSYIIAIAEVNGQAWAVGGSGNRGQQFILGQRTCS